VLTIDSLTLLGQPPGHSPAGSGRPPSARQRILGTASALFYRVGIRAVGIDRIIAEAGVAKATFYHHFPTKDALVCAYLTDQHDRQEAGLGAAVASGREPVELILAVFDVLGELSCGPGFRGCAFVNAAIEYPDPESPVRRVVAEHRQWFQGVLRTLLVDAGHPEPESGARMLATLRDGIVVGGQLDRPAEVTATLRASVTALLGPLGTAAKRN
jgi:AcrR family transcriptional regulator